MFKNLLLTFFLLFSSFITILPSKKENTNLTDYCYSLEKILSRNSLKKSKNIQNKYKSFAKDLKFFDRFLLFSNEFLEIIFSRE